MEHPFKRLTGKEAAICAHFTSRNGYFSPKIKLSYVCRPKISCLVMNFYLCTVGHLNTIEQAIRKVKLAHQKDLHMKQPHGCSNIQSGDTNDNKENTCFNWRCNYIGRETFKSGKM